MFFKSLFDVNFENFITRQVAKVIYILVMMGLGLFLFFAEISGFYMFSLTDGYGNSQAGYGLLLILGSPVAALACLILVRLGIESSIALISIAENTRKK